jgi:hypothetical protein
LGKWLVGVSFNSPAGVGLSQLQLLVMKIHFTGVPRRPLVSAALRYTRQRRHRGAGSHRDRWSFQGKLCQGRRRCLGRSGQDYPKLEVGTRGRNSRWRLTTRELSSTVRLLVLALTSSASGIRHARSRSAPDASENVLPCRGPDLFAHHPRSCNTTYVSVAGGARRVGCSVLGERGSSAHLRIFGVRGLETLKAPLAN